MSKIREFKVVQNILNEQEGNTSVTRILKPVSDLKKCNIQIKVTASDIKAAEEELEFSLNRGDSVFLEILKTGKQKKLPKEKP